MEVSGQLRASVALPQGKEPSVTVGWEAGWAPEPVWTLWSTEESLTPAGNRTLAVEQAWFST
jgi:hypothetical protein